MKIARSLNLLNYDNRPVMSLTLPNGEKLNLTLPTKGLISKLTGISQLLEGADENDADSVLESIYELTAQILSCNINGRVITKEFLESEEGLDFEQVLIVFQEYKEFVNGVKESKN